MKKKKRRNDDDKVRTKFRGLENRSLNRGGPEQKKC